MLISFLLFSFFFFNDTATTEIYTLSLHDALPISNPSCREQVLWSSKGVLPSTVLAYALRTDRKSTRLNSSHQIISYAVFCLKKKNKNTLLVEQYEQWAHWLMWRVLRGSNAVHQRQ